MPPDAPSASDLWARIGATFDAVVELPAGERAAALDRLCRDAAGRPDPALQAEVESLLEADAGATAATGSLHPADVAAASVLVDDGGAPGERVGPWVVVRPLGRGGMGRVDLVERADGAYVQRAALKRLALVAPDRVRRFLLERQILATLDHPGVARLLDGGVGPDGAPYLVMEYVAGEPITAYADRHGLGLRARLQLFLQVADAVAFAHRHLVVHRDLKPSNVLVGERAARTTEPSGSPGSSTRAEDDGLTRATGLDGAHVTLLDFGIARLLDPEADEPITAEGPAAPLTPGYAAPEQVEGAAITTATDVWALGVLLYELLSGRRPFAGRNRDAWARDVLLLDPEPPSQAARTGGDAPSTRGRADLRRLRGDLDAICLTALRRRPEDRYASALDLAADLRRYLAGEPVEARRPSPGYRARRFVGRHKAAVVTAALVTMAVLGGAGSTLWQARATRAAAAESAATADFLADLLGAADPLAEARRDTLRVGALLDEGVARTRAELGGQPRVQARLLHVLGRTYRRIERWDESEPLLRDALALYRRLGVPPATRADVLGELALTQSARAEHAEAVALAGEALALAHADGDSETLLQAERTLGGVRLRALPSSGPDSLLLVARDRARGLYGDSHLTVAELELDLSEAYLDAGQVEEALHHIHQGIEDATRALGPDHPRLIAYHHTLALASLFAGRMEEAEAASARAIALARSTSPGSNRLGQALTIHAQALRRLGRLDEAAAELREAIALTTRRSIDSATPLGTLASVLDESGDLEGAIVAQAESLRRLRDGAGGRPIVVTSGLKLADLLTRAGRHAAAEVTLDEAAAVRGGLVLPNEAFAALLDRQLARARVALYEAWGRPEAAEPFRALASAGGAPDGLPGGGSPHGREVRMSTR